MTGAPAGVPAIECRNVHKTYRLSRSNIYEALRGVDLAIPSGELAAIIGPSGSGKSTLLNLLGTLDRPTSGSILIDGVDTNTLSDNALAELRNRKLGFVFQNYSLINRMTAVQNVALPMVALGRSIDDRESRARAALESVGLASKFRNRPVEMSGGEQQRVAIARALACEPSILLADEPTGNLDTKTSHDILDLLGEINETLGVTVALITHEIDIARRTRRIIRIRDGLVEGEGLPEVAVV
ncbi:MAG: ABC transporter ATP-binding protein [Thermoplasmatota archaeon]